MHREFYVGPGYVCATWRNVIINLCRDELTMETLAAGRRAGDELESEFGPDIGVVTVISPSMKMPTEEVRTQAAKDMEAASHRIKANATVIPGTGFRASAFRTAYATLTLFSKTSAPNKVASSVDEGAGFLLETLGHDPGLRAEFLSAIEACEARLDAI